MRKVILFFLVTCSVFAHTSDYIISVKSGRNYENHLKKFQQMDLDVAGVDYKNKIIDLVVSENEIELLNNKKIKFSYSFVKGVSKGIDGRYHNPQEIEQFLKETNRLYPSITHLKIIGVSSGGRNIFALKISDNASFNEAEPKILFNSMHHAREIMTPEVGVDIVDYLTSNYSSDAQVRNWVDQNEIWVVPMLNVDGNDKVWNGNSMWRKNTAYGHGVDINRNYPYMWGSCRGSSGMRYSDTYRGPKAGSENEVKALMSLVAEVKPTFNISYHSYSELVIYPYGCRGKRSGNRSLVEGIGKELGTTMNYSPGTAWELLYSVDGGDIDWMHGIHDVNAYVLEVNSRSVGFHPDYDQWRDKTVKRNRAGWQLLLNKLQQSSIQGKFSKANALVKFYKKNSSRIYQLVKEFNLPASGYFHKAVLPGEYEIRVEDKVNYKKFLVTVKNQAIILQ